MARNASDVLVEGLLDWGVSVVFGLPGDGINGIMEALRQRQDQIRFVQVRHEEAAAFMACAYAKYTGRLGCCLATSGPGGIHLLNGLYDAKMDQAPVLALTGQTYSDLKGSLRRRTAQPRLRQVRRGLRRRGLTVREPKDIRPALEKALHAGKPTLVEVYVDPNEPPMPAKISATQALHFAEVLVCGQPEGGRIALTLFRDKLDELIGKGRFPLVESPALEAGTLS
jgi:thiamine pyrophosphate-dependent acetolactate synthase large subunit-like protein